MILSYILLIIGRIAWAYHDCYFWDNTTKYFVNKIGWHVVKMIMMIACAVSLILMTVNYTFWNAVLYIFASWSAFEFGMYLATQDFPYASFGDWLTAWWLVVKPKERPMTNMELKRAKANVIEFILHYGFRLHWVESSLITLIVGVLLVINK